ncbi:glycosyltransferase family 4 protein [Hymenobacter actinosclerus]|uniref:Glycosyltransferase involved in cell wall bisynthesis n=1 Tax=Hymenobacter actinosclerus TaxID=82805 RepID=A0A1I0EXE8_9BACT|nr:glycosyltransferase family 4 protein [Hymenobacter actinosclerus]SET49600.1 Glycosyltransferase involved in cell wall bisynthesis [Hymenobacter actinosclerus]
MNSRAPFPLSILCLSDSWGGLELNTARFAGWMRERGWPVQVITRAGSPLAARAAELGATVVTLENPWKALDLPAAGRLASALRTFESRALLISRNGDLGLAVLCQRLYLPELPLVYQQHMQLGLAKRGLVHTLRYRALAAWLAPLPGLARQVLEKTRLSPEKLHVVPLGVELEKFADAQLTTAEARRRLQLELPPGTVLLGLVGRLDDGKGQDFVVETMAGLRQQFPQLHLLLVGEPTRNEGNAYADALRTRIQELGLSEVVHLRGFTPQPEVAYRALDISITASVSETYGMVTIEALAAGKPVLGAAAGGTRELLDDSRTGLLFELHNQASFAAVVARLLQEPGLMERLGRAGQQEAFTTYSHHRQCELTEQILWAVA